jgi:hypothetical protein
MLVRGFERKAFAIVKEFLEFLRKGYFGFPIMKCAYRGQVLL